MRVWVRRKDVDLLRRCRKIVSECPWQAMPRRVVMGHHMVMVVHVGRWVCIHGGPRALMGMVISRVRTGAYVGTAMGVVHAVIVPVGDGDVCAAVTVSENHLGGEGVGAVVV